MSRNELVQGNGIEDRMKSFTLGLIDWKSYSIMVLFSVVSTALFIYSPLELNNVIKKAGKIDTEDIVFVIGLLVLSYITDFLCVFLRNEYERRYSVRLEGRIIGVIFRMDYDSYLKEGATSLVQKGLDIMNSFSEYLYFGLPRRILNACIILIILFIAFRINPQGAFIMLLILPVHFFGFKILNKKLSELSVELSQIASTSFSHIISIVSQVDFIKQNPDNSGFLRKVETYMDRYKNQTRKVNNVAIGVSGLLMGVNNILQVLIVILFTSIALNNPSAFGELAFIMMILPYYNNAVRTFSSTNISLSQYRASKEILMKFLAASEEDGDTIPPDVIESIQFDIPEVTVEDKLLLRNVSMEFRKGDVIGVMGESGKGKSTLLKLIPKFRKSEGIRINHIPIKELKNEVYRYMVSYYSQNPPIINDTLLNNLSLGSDCKDGLIYRSIQFLSKFNDLDEMINEDGSNLSGGDRQRIALARFFTEKAQIVILDEPTSSLDKTTEEEVFNEILRYSEDKIIFIVTHNRELLNHCTHILRVENGTAVSEELDRIIS